MSRCIERRRWLGRATALALTLVLAGCAGLGDPNVVTVSERDLERLTQRHFPVERRVAEAFEVTLLAPRLRLLPERNRVAAVLDLRARERLLGGQWSGRLDFDAALRWEPGDQTVRLDQVRVRDLALSDPGAPTRSAAERIGAALAERALENLDIYRLPAERALELQRRGLAPGTLSVTPNGLEIRFVPLTR